jgi:hypothetical protein
VHKWVTAAKEKTCPFRNRTTRRVLIQQVDGDKQIRNITRITVIDGPILERKKALLHVDAFWGGMSSLGQEAQCQGFDQIEA